MKIMLQKISKSLINHVRPYRRFLFLLFCCISLLVMCTYPMPVGAGLAEDLITQEGWRTISLDFESASLINILKIFSQQSGLNFIAEPNIANRPITLYLENVPLREALEKILNFHNLTYELDEGSNIFIVKQLIKPEVDLMTKVYPLQYTHVSTSPINSESTVTHTGLIDAVQAQLSTYGKLIEDSRTNSLVVTDVPNQFDMIEATIKRLDVPVPQVVIEVEILDAKKSLVDTLGFDWRDTASIFSYTLSEYTSHLALPLGSKFQEAGDMTMGTITAGGVGNSLELLRKDTDTKLLARPKILTLSNETAEIEISSEEALAAITTEDTETNTQTTTYERFDIGVKMKVTPSVNVATGEITMVLEPDISSAQTAVVTGSNGEAVYDPTKRRAKVTIKANDNDTIILGGLIRHDIEDAKYKLVGLGDIPFIGSLFRYKDKTDTERELLIFITPRIVDDGRSNQRVAQGNQYQYDVLAQREQSIGPERKNSIDKSLNVWDNN